MDALNLHYAIFTSEKASNLPLRSASSFLRPVPERDESLTGRLFSSTTYQDLIQRQPTHPGGPTLGWDLGLNLFGDPVTHAEHKNLEDHHTKMKLRRLHATNIVFELLFGTWGMYTTVRYFLAFVDRSGDTEHTCALVLGTTSALVVTLVIVSVLMPLFPIQRHLYAWRHTRSVLRACYLLLLSASAVMNLVLVLIWRSSHFCGWDIDISWYTSDSNTVTSGCHPASSAVWLAAAILRLLVTCAMALSFIYTLRSYHKARHPHCAGSSPKYSPYFPTDSEEMPPVETSPRHLLKSMLKLSRSQDSDRTLGHPNIALPKSGSISTLAPSCTGHSRSHSTPPPKYIPPLKISPPTSRKISIHVTSHASTQFRSETSSHTQPVNIVTESSSTSHILRQSSRISVAKVMSDAMQPDTSFSPERFDGQMITRDPSEMQSCPSWRLGHRGAGAHPDNRKSTLAWENTSVSHASHSNVGSGSSVYTHEGGDSINEKDKIDEDVVYSYGYGAYGPTYPYLDMYNPQGPGRYTELSSCDVNEHGIPPGHRLARAFGPSFPDASSDPSSLTREEDEETSSGEEEGEEEEEEREEEEYIAMMGGFVRRMATIESLGSKEADSTLSTTNSAARHYSMRSNTSASQFSSVRFAEYGSSSCKSWLAPPLSAQGSRSTAYLSFSSGSTGVRVNERGELLLGPSANKSTAGSLCYYTASASSFPRMGDDRSEE